MRTAESFLIGALCVVLYVIGAAETLAQQSSGEVFALEFRDHVVRIRTDWANGQQQDGFGFVVGQNATGVYIVTANHVVRGSRPDEVAEAVELTWFRRKGEQFSATLLGTSDADRDIAVLRTELPSGVELRPELMVFEPGRLQRGTQVWFVGRVGDWYVPSTSGIVNSVDLNDQILVDGLNFQVGTSGAPLTTAAGIAGVIIEDAGGVARATAMSFVARAFDAWAHPWDMREGEFGSDPSGEARATPTPGFEQGETEKKLPGAEARWFVFLGSFPHSDYDAARRLQLNADARLSDETLIINTDDYSNLRDGLYSVVIGSDTRADAEAIQLQVVQFVRDAYIKQPGVFSGN